MNESLVPCDYCKKLVSALLTVLFYYTPTTKCGGGGGYTGFALSRRSVRPSVSNSCPLYNSFTNRRISFKLE